MTETSLQEKNLQILPKKAKDRVFDRKGSLPTEYFKDQLFDLEAKGELIVHRIEEDNFVEVRTKFGRTKKIPIQNTWHHKSCGQCGHIPGYSTAIYWLHRKLGLKYHDPRDQTSCTAWNYYASSASNPAAQASIAIRNFAQAYQDGFFPLIHCGTSYGHYKETRNEILHHPKLRDQVRRVLDKLGKPLVFPEEIVHYSEWIHAMLPRMKEHITRDFSNITVTVHPACHYHKLVTEDAIYDKELYDGQRTAVVSSVVLAMKAKLADYSTWHDCCGFGFRHILVSRDFSRSFSTIRKIERMKEEANPDLLLTHDTGCVTTLDKSQFAARAHNRNVNIPVLSDAQFAALALGAHPYKVCQMHWHGVDNKPIMEKMGIDHVKAWDEFQAQVKRIENKEIEYITWEDAE
ncbi:MAG: heterodisulfide reductase-related iron-sulfur binding cluster [Deltaproteobacteria bacterium]|nr:heterodisulfide reductase-related iron-sulfur binding cluster [Deltaproteobacteria bacterium]